MRFMEYNIPELAELPAELRACVQFLIDYCDANGVEFYYREPTVPVKRPALIISSGEGRQGIIGYTASGEIKIHYKDEALFKWAKMEGFETEEVPEKVPNSVREVSLQEIAKLFIK